MIKIKDIIYIFLITVLFCLYLRKSRTKENFANEKFSKSLVGEVKKIINATYIADIDAIRNLSDISVKLQKGNLTIPGNLKIQGKLTVDKDAEVKGGMNTLKVNNLKVNDYAYANRLDIKGKHGTTHFNHNNKGNTYLRDNVYVHDYLYTNRLDIKGKHGITHFNHDNKGNTYLRDNVYVHDYLKTNRLDINGKRGITHFNHDNKGNTYLRDDIKDTAGMVKFGNHFYLYQTQHWGGPRYVHGHRGDRLGVADNVFKTKFRIDR